ncbi:MAG: hypothetical protein ACFFD1_10480 [Candidatus Thorarchaeota archaeon]
MKFELQKNQLFWYLLSALATWLIFLSSFLFLTEALMYFMGGLNAFILFLVVGIVLLFLNYFIFKLVVFKTEVIKPTNTSFIQNYHELFSGLDRLLRIIVILVTLGFMSSLITFLIACMTFFNTEGDLIAVIELTPFLLVFYLFFIIPSFYGVKEIRNIKGIINNFDEIKSDFRKVLNNVQESATN